MKKDERGKNGQFLGLLKRDTLHYVNGPGTDIFLFSLCSKIRLSKQFLMAELEKRSSRSNVTGKISVNYSVLPTSTENSQQRSAQDRFLDIFDSIIR